jgi:tetratricopeptide (TPR) repeat protein
MNDSALVRFYHTYLETQDSAGFIASVSLRYRNSTLEAMAIRGGALERRAATLALGYLGDYTVNTTIGRALRDEDRGVRLIAESGIRNVWMSVGTVEQRRQLEVAERFVAADRHAEALTIACSVVRSSTKFAEAWRMRGVANFGRGEFRTARKDFRQVIFHNPYQFQAAIGLGNCHIRMLDAAGALRWFQRALRINPGLERIRVHVARLSKSLEQS